MVNPQRIDPAAVADLLASQLDAIDPAVLWRRGGDVGLRDQVRSHLIQRTGAATADDRRLIAVGMALAMEMVANSGAAMTPKGVAMVVCAMDMLEAEI